MGFQFLVGDPYPQHTHTLTQFWKGGRDKHKDAFWLHHISDYIIQSTAYKDFIVFTVRFSVNMFLLNWFNETLLKYMFLKIFNFVKPFSF